MNMEHDYKLTTPVLLIVFNRPKCVQEVFSAIRNAKPEKLYIFADGPRENNEADTELCSMTRSITELVDWECDVKRYYSDINLGCGVGPYTGINWVFENEESAIILEDDCVPNDSFFRFCQELLNRYEDTENIMTISGSNYGIDTTTSNDYFFTHYNNTWGWATWKRVWKLYDYNLKDYFKYNWVSKVKDIVLFDSYADIWRKTFEPVASGTEKTVWDAQFMYMSFINNGLHIFPKKNMVKCIGFGNDGTHTINTNENNRIVYGTKDYYDMSFPLKHPKEIYEDFRADCIIMQEIFGGESSKEITFSETQLISIKTAKTIILYGAGKNCAEVIDALNREGINHFVIATTEVKEDTFVMGNKVRGIVELVDTRDALVIITAKNEKNINDMKNTLKELGFNDSFSIFD